MQREDRKWKIEDRTVWFAILPLLLAILLLPLAGCAGYHLGPVNPEVRAGSKTIEILPFHNQTLQPRLGDTVTQTLRERVQSDGTYHLARNGDADLIVNGTITTYSRRPVSFLSTDVTTAKNFRIEIVAHVIVRERASGKVVLDKNLAGYTLTQTGTELAEEERQSLPLLAADLARKVVEQLTEGSW
jgi:Lipopolysaccharide-assembly